MSRNDSQKPPSSERNSSVIDWATQQLGASIVTLVVGALAVGVVIGVALMWFGKAR